MKTIDVIGIVEDAKHRIETDITDDHELVSQLHDVIDFLNKLKLHEGELIDSVTEKMLKNNTNFIPGYAKNSTQKIEQIQEKLKRWEHELQKISTDDRWGETRRFAGRSAGKRIERRQWLISHIADAKVKLNQMLGGCS